MTTAERTSDTGQLPQGLKAGARLHRRPDGSPPPSKIGVVYQVSDERIPKGPSLNRVARLLKASEPTAEWLPPLERQAIRLLGCSLPYVCTVREVGRLPHGGLYLLEDSAPDCLHTRIRKDSGLPPTVARRIARQLLVGLSALHRAEIFHGDLRPANILLTSQEADADSWIADTATGGLRYWSRDIQSENACRYSRPPRDGHRPAEPTEADDLYALGLTLAEMLGGWDANPKHDADPAQQDASSEDGEPPTIQAEVGKRLKRIGNRDPVLRKVIERLLNEGQPITAAEAVELLDAEERRTFQRQRLVGWGVALVAAVVGICLLLSLLNQVVVAKSEVDQLQTDKTNLRGDHEKAGEKLKEKHVAEVKKLEAKHRVKVTTLNEEHQVLRTEIQRLKDIIAGLPQPGPSGTDSPPPPPTDKSEQSAKHIWAQAVDTELLFREQLEAFSNIVGQEKDANIKLYLSRWHMALQKLYGTAKGRFQRKSELNRRYAAAQAKPWKAESTKALTNYLQAIDIWRRWALDSQRTFQDLEGLAKSSNKEVPNDEIANILQGWLIDYERPEKGPRTYKLRLINGKAPAGSGIARVGDIQADEDGPIPPHVWKFPTTHAYPIGPGEVSIPFTWSPDTPITVRLEEDGYSYDADLINKTVRGPLALWRLHDKGFVAQGTARLEFEIKDCPGPPPSRPRKKPVPSKPTRKPVPAKPTRKPVPSNELGPIGDMLR